MLAFLFRKGLPLPSPIWRNVGSSNTHLRFLLDFAPVFQTRCFSSIEVAEKLGKCSFTESYLINSCGLSPASAKSASKYVHFRDSANPDLVLSFLRNHGFTNAHISRVVRSFPRVLLFDAKKTVLPKFEFFHSIGISGANLATLISRNPSVLGRSLNRQIIPCYDFLKTHLVHDEIVAKSLIKQSWVLLQNLQKDLSPNISVLRGVGVPDSLIRYMLVGLSESLCLDTNKFKEKVENVLSMGFNPSKYAFLEAIKCWPSKKAWQLKREAYKSWGLSEDEMWLAFRKDPKFMASSIKKVTGVLDFLVNKMGWHPVAVARVPSVFNFSLKKRIIPRCSVLRVLRLKGLMKKEIAVSSVVISSEKCFLDRFVFRYQEHAPQLLSIFQGKLDILELDLPSKEEIGAKLK
ncbi:hypothetical protein SLA2020_165000 [Shorea laevis]